MLGCSVTPRASEMGTEVSQGARPCCSHCDGIRDTEAGTARRCRCGTHSLGWDSWDGPCG